MESTGIRNRIQISQSTAELLEQDGRDHWFHKRDDIVQAKGKGQVQTYWIRTKSSSAGKMEDTLESKETHMSNTNPRASSHHRGNNSVPKRRNNQTLIDWQVALLSRLIKQIVAHRGRQTTQLLSNLVTKEVLPRELIAEKISMPEFSHEKSKRCLEATSVELPEVVLQQLKDLVTAIALLYNDNSFHNFNHACHVTMTANKLLSRVVVPIEQNTDEIMKEAHDFSYGLTSDPLTQFAIVFSALIHDLEHPGVTNGQLVEEENRLATLYHGESVAEQHSIDLTLELLAGSDYKDLVSCICANEEEFARFRQLVINCVLATDVFDKELLAMRNSRWEKAFSTGNKHGDTFDFKATIVIEHLIQAADVGHTMQHWHVYQKWNEKLFAEMCESHKAGRGPVKAPAETWYQGELWFFDNYIIPLARKLKDCGVFGVNSDECLMYALENRKEWESKGHQVVAELMEKYCNGN